MLPGSLPLSQLVLLDLVAPPALAFAWALLSGGWAAIVQGGKVSDETQQRQKTEFWAILVMTFLMGVGCTVHGVRVADLVGANFRIADYSPRVPEKLQFGVEKS